MTKILDDFIREFHAESPFTEEKKPSPGSGSQMATVHLRPEVTFEILEVLYGEYKDVNAHFTFIDDKSHWERYFKGPNGIFRVYDYRGHVSIGSQSLNLFETPSKAYKNDVEKFKALIEGAAEKYKAAKVEDLEKQVSESPMANFSRGFLSTKFLLDRAKNSGSLLELLVLNATLLDATLRLGIILSIQLREKNDHVQREMILQESKAFISERMVYTFAKNEGILSENDFTEANELYDFRNTAIHRYFISGLEYMMISPVISQYERIHGEVAKKVNELEEEQVKQGVGMTKKEDIELSEEIIHEIRRQELLKIDSSISVAVVPERKFMFREGDDE